jgi:hypothetical protein
MLFKSRFWLISHLVNRSLVLTLELLNGSFDWVLDKEIKGDNVFFRK